ncbi:MAG TPA: hypothetical protein ENK18_16825 [Deltaproteobacteria bacterium]|nr:hypothetical protein [Deltaproteobacteria bacterium]
MILVSVLAAAHAAITLEAPPVLGEETVVVVLDAEGHPRAGQTVRVVHRRGLAAQREFAVGITDGRGRVRWTPQMAGLARVRAGEEPLDVRIDWTLEPTSIPLLLGLLSLGGLAAFGYGVGVGARRP